MYLSVGSFTGIFGNFLINEFLLSYDLGGYFGIIPMVNHMNASGDSAGSVGSSGSSQGSSSQGSSNQGGSYGGGNNVGNTDVDNVDKCGDDTQSVAERFNNAQSDFLFDKDSDSDSDSEDKKRKKRSTCCNAVCDRFLPKKYGY
jgi:hypothetical protein